MLIAVAVVLAVAYSYPDLKRLAMSTRDGALKPAAPEKAAIRDRPSADRDAASVVQAVTLSHRAPAHDTTTPPPEGKLGSQPASAPPKGPAPDTLPIASAAPPVADRAKAPTVRPALEAALGLMSSGGVLAARQQLLAMVAADGAPDIAWALARSYDPNFLGTIPGADASPDIDEAARWYRIWYAAAVKEGSVADSVSLERIIGSMRQ